MKLEDLEYDEIMVCCKKCKYVVSSAFGFVCRNEVVENGNDIDSGGIGLCRLFQPKNPYKWKALKNP